MIILGVNAYHSDASACLLRDGALLAASEEERFRRIKHWAGFPSEAVRHCLSESSIKIEDVEHVAINQDSQANLLEKVSYTLLRRPSLSLVLDRLHNKQRRMRIDDEIARIFGQQWSRRTHSVEHHLAHLGSAFLASRFDEAVSVSVDGFGDFASGAWGLGRGGLIEADDRVYFPHSLGIFYQAITQYLGFPHYGDEYKVMGLAPYGELRYMEQMRRIVRLVDDGTYALDLSYFRHAQEKVEYEWEDCQPVVGTLYSAALEKLLGEARAPGAPLERRH